MRGLALEVADLKREGGGEGRTAVWVWVCKVSERQTFLSGACQWEGAYEDSMMIRSGWYFSASRASEHQRGMYGVKCSDHWRFRYLRSLAVRSSSVQPARSTCSSECKMRGKRDQAGHEMKYRHAAVQDLADSSQTALLCQLTID